MKPFDICIAYISWGVSGKRRPVLVYAINDTFVRIFPITTQYKRKSEVIRARHFKINDFSQAGLDMQSYVDTGTRLKLPLSVFDNVTPIGGLTQSDKQRLLEFLTKYYNQ